MITSKKELRYYLLQDQRANHLSTDKIMRFFPPCYATIKATCLMRKAEYYLGTGRVLLGKIYAKRMKRFCRKLGMELSVNVFGPGLRIAHPFGIVVTGRAKIGCNCFLHQGVTIGTNENEKGAPCSGDNFVAGAGAKIIGDVSIADGVCVGANAVVVKSINTPNSTWGGVPAKQISDNSSKCYLSPYLFRDQK